MPGNCLKSLVYQYLAGHFPAWSPNGCSTFPYSRDMGNGRMGGRDMGRDMNKYLHDDYALLNYSLLSFSDGYDAAIHILGDYIKEYSPTGKRLGELRQLRDYLQKRKDRTNMEFALELVILMHKLDNTA